MDLKHRGGEGEKKETSNFFSFYDKSDTFLNLCIVFKLLQTPLKI